MNSTLAKTFILRQDSVANLTILQDSVVVEPIAVSSAEQDSNHTSIVEDTLASSSSPLLPVQDTLVKHIQSPKHTGNQAQSEIQTQRISESNKQPESELKPVKRPEIERFSLFVKSDSQSFAVKPEVFLQTEFTQAVHPPGKLEQIIHVSKLSYLNWTLLVGLICVILLLALKSYYKKFTSRIVNTLVNFQLADKMLREKNIIVRRAFFIMNLNYVMVSGLFILLLTIYFGFRITASYPLDYLLINAVIIGILISRLVLYYVAGYLFDRLPSVIEHIHMVYLVNKNLGLVLLPISFFAIYTSLKFSELLLFIGIGIVAIATVYKLIRGFQIIYRSGVLLFYAILYLCTLEVLPLLLGAKLIMSLR